VLADISGTGPSPDIATMAHDADVQLAGATFPEPSCPRKTPPYLSTARKVGEHAFNAGARKLVPTHLWPGTDPSAARDAARQAYAADLDIANPGMIIKLG
jgi:ribonuclease BN (tRNA processing enzyme)